ncbi:MULTISPECIES: hypothetical protein [Enterococcaceae]|uniref:hypothetical protein n=1 Tax=Enterococcaceae TaxID=81852 RepID=UPI000E4CAF29|nr:MULTISPECIES: hypothetical protein [Enterococcaceae]MCI0130094.1 hypothetical protein [Vagococcus sp. CY53-2]RGI30953.1 hypothetical protein DXC12_04980 [Melissococcus sp. OM08-11BH]UNM88914.1 hypothetical protein MN187_06355 [Vagococcus sp. CY52-2]
MLKKPNIGQYLQVINAIVTESEKVGEKMNPSYEIIRTAIDEGNLSDLTVEQLTDIKSRFSEGTEEYRVMENTLSHLKAPVRVLGIHKKLEKAFKEYVEGCQEMIDSIDAENARVDSEVFDVSELKQDAATDGISFCIQRITQIILNK